MDSSTKVALVCGLGQVLVGAASILAIFKAPILALKIQKDREEKTSKRDRQLALFRTLMTYRATPLNVHFVQGLNSIDIEFDEDTARDRKVRGAWTVLLDHFTNDRNQPDFGARTQDLIIKLLSEMSGALGYTFDEVYIRRHSYYPIAHGSIEEEQNELRRLLLELLRTNRGLPVAVFEERFPDLPIRKPVT